MQKLRRRERTLVASLCYKLVTAYNERVVACTALELEMLQYLFFVVLFGIDTIFTTTNYFGN